MEVLRNIWDNILEKIGNKEDEKNNLKMIEPHQLQLHRILSFPSLKSVPEIKEDYRLFVDGILVHVSSSFHSKNISTPVDDTPLLNALQESCERLVQKQSNNPFPGTPIFHDIVMADQLNPTFFQDIRQHKQEELISLVKEYNLVHIQTDLLKYNLVHLCLLGNFQKSLKFLLETPILIDNLRSSNISLNYATFAAAHNLADPLHLLLPMNFSYYELTYLMRAAEHFGNPTFSHAATQFTRKKLEILFSQDQNHKCEYSFSGYFLLPPKRTIIPSLFTICSHVVASQVIYGSAITDILMRLSNVIVESVCSSIALYPIEGFNVLQMLKNKFPSESHKIPTLAWVDSARHKEQRTRDFMQNQFYNDSNDPGVLIDVFENTDQFVIEPEDDFESTAKIYCVKPKQVGSPSIVNQKQFFDQFNAFTHELFEGFDFSNVVLTGECISVPLLSIPSSYSHISLSEYYNNFSPFKASGIDLCLYGLELHEAQQKMRDIYEYLSKKTNREVTVFQNYPSYFFLCHFPYRQIKITFLKYRSIWDVLTYVPCDAAAVAYEGAKLLAVPRAQMALNKRWNISDGHLLKFMGTFSYVSTLLKFSKCGFAIVDRDHDIHRIGGIQDNLEFMNAPNLLERSLHDEIAAAWLQEVDKRHNWLPYGPNIGTQEIEDFVDEIRYLHSNSMLFMEQVNISDVDKKTQFGIKEGSSTWCKYHWSNIDLCIAYNA